VSRPLLQICTRCDGGDVLHGEGSVDANLIGVLDFFGQPSFLIWSFDRADVGNARDHATQLRSRIDVKIGQIKTVHDQLLSQVNQHIDARWDQLTASVPRS
jgi:hypothetical protein